MKKKIIKGGLYIKMASLIQKYNIIKSGQYSSVSSIEKLNNDPSINNLNSEYRLNLQTKAHISMISDIYLNRRELENCLMIPLKRAKENHDLIQNIIIKNIIPAKNIKYYNLIRNIHSGFLLSILRSKGCRLNLKMEYTVEDDRFIIIKPNMTIGSFIFKHKPKEIQPADIRLSMEDTDKLLSVLDNI
jgi:hypothetical protein